MRKIDKIIIHCSATEAGHNFSARDIDVWHKQRGFNGIGYHYVIKLDGTVEEGRPLEKIGAHCVGQNGNSIGICYIGGMSHALPKDTRTPEQKKALVKLVKQLTARFPRATVHGHNEFAPKACPCFDVKAEFGELNATKS